MTSREKLLRKPIYWFDHEQNELFRQVSSYMEKENINQTELAERFGFTKGYISQILNGNFNYTLKKLIEISLAIGVVPRITYDKIDDVIKEDNLLKSYYNSDLSIFKENVIPFAINKNLSEYIYEQDDERIGINPTTQYVWNEFQDIPFIEEKLALIA